MNAATFDSLQFVRILRDRGSFTTEQAENLADAISSTLHDDLATKGDIAALKGDIAALKGDISAMKSDLLTLKDGVAFKIDLLALRDSVALKSDLRELELRLETKIAETKSDILKWMFGQTIVVIGVVLALSHVAH